MKKLLLHVKLACLVLILAMPVMSHAQSMGNGVNTSYGNFSGLMFGDYYYKMHADSLHRGATQYAGVAKDFNTFDIRRVYLRHRYTINSKFSTELLLAQEGQTGNDGNRTFYMKAANIKWSGIFKGTDMVFGQQATPTFATANGSEPIWAYRSIEKTLSDMRSGVDNTHSTDLGIALFGHYLNEKLNYDFMVANNSGAKISATTSKKVYADVYTKLLDKRLEIQVYTDYQQYNFNFYTDANKNKVQYQTTSMSLKGFVAWVTPVLTVGVEPYMYTKNNIARTAKNDGFLTQKQQGISFFAHATLLKDSAKNAVLRVFARYDNWNPDGNYKSSDNFGTGVDYIVTKSTAPIENFMTFGLDYLPNKNVHIMPNIWVDSYVTKTNSTSKVIERNDKDVVARLTVFYTF